MKKIVIVAFGLLSVFGAFGIVSSVAQWPDDPSLNLLLSNNSGEQSITKVVPAPDGGCYVSWWDNTSGNYDFYLQRLDANGVIQWAEDGLLISNNPQDTWLTDYDLAVDSLGYAIITLNDLRAGGDWDIYAYRISPAGEFAWGPNGLTISNNTGFEADPQIIVTTAGNVVFAWQEDYILHLRKVTPEGADFWDPPTKTLTHTYPLSIPRVAQAESDGFILQYLKSTGPNYMYDPKHLYARKYDAAGNEVWSPGGVVVSNAGGFGMQMKPAIASDGAGGAFSYWYDSRDMNLHAYAQHVLPGGTMAWTANGVLLSSAAGQIQMSPAFAYLPASNETVYFFENSNTDQTIFGLYAQKLDSTGARRWGAGALALVPMNAQPRMLLRGATVGNDAVVIFLENTPGSFVYSFVKAIRVNPAGEQVWEPSPQTLSNVTNSKGYLDACANSLGQTIAVWKDNRIDTDGDVYLQNINADGSLGPLGPLPGAIEGLVMLPDGTTPAESVIVSTFDSGDVLVGTDTTGADGIYGLILDPGTYHELLVKPGYQDTTIDNIVVVAGVTTHVGVTLRERSGCVYIPGDFNFNGAPNGIDVVYGVNYFKGGSAPPVDCGYPVGPCPQPSPFYAAMDVNGNCAVNGIDITFFVNFLKGIQPALLYCPSCPPAM